MPAKLPDLTKLVQQGDTLIQLMRKAEADRAEFRRTLDMIILKLDEAERCATRMGDQVCLLQSRVTALENRLRQ